MPSDALKVVVVGAGPAGVMAALRAAERGARTTLVTRDAVGGLAANDGRPVTKCSDERLHRPGVVEGTHCPRSLFPHAVITVAQRSNHWCDRALIVERPERPGGISSSGWCDRSDRKSVV